MTRCGCCARRSCRSFIDGAVRRPFREFSSCRNKWFAAKTIGRIGPHGNRIRHGQTAAAASVIRTHSPLPGYAATADEAKSMAERAAAYITQVGPEKAFADLHPCLMAASTRAELYVFCYDHDGVNKAHGANAAFVGKNPGTSRIPTARNPISRSSSSASSRAGLGGLQVAQSDHQEDPAEIGLRDAHQRRRVWRRLL